MNTESLYEEAFIIRSRLGDEAAFAELYAIYDPKLRAFAQRLLQSSPAQVDDALQETWFAVFKSLPKLSSNAKFKAWLFRIARDQIFQAYRKIKGFELPLDEDEEIEIRQDRLDNESAIDAEVLQCHLGELSAEQREAVVLHYFEDLSYHEIAEITATSIGTIRSRIHYAKEILRQKMRKNL